MEKKQRQESIVADQTRNPSALVFCLSERSVAAASKEAALSSSLTVMSWSAVGNCPNVPPMNEIFWPQRHVYTV